jgi:hypothetical protein
VFRAAGVLHTFSGGVLHRRGVLHQRAFYAFFRACFAPTVRFTLFPGCFAPAGVVCTSVLFTHFSGRVLQRWGFLSIFQACFAQAGRFADLPELFPLSGCFTPFAGVVRTAGVFHGAG